MPDDSNDDPVDHPVLLVGLDAIYGEALSTRLNEEEIPTVIAQDEFHGYTIIKSQPISAVLIERKGLSEGGIDFLRVVQEIQSKTRRLVVAPESEFDLAMEERYRGKLEYILFEAQPVGEMASAIKHAANSYCLDYYSEFGLE